MVDKSLRFVLLGEDRSASRTVDRFAGRSKAAMGELGRLGSLATKGPILAAAAATVAVIKLGTAYQDNLNIFQAVSDANGAQMQRVGAEAKALGNDLTLPATSAAGAAAAMTELAKAGMSVHQSMAAAKGTLLLAAAAQTTEADAAETVANALNAFQLPASQAGRVADLLAASANASSAEIGDMAYALKAGASQAHSAGVPIQDLTTALAELANQGIKGAEAGTTVKMMLLRLQAPTENAASVLERYNIAVYDSTGRMRPLRDLVADFTKQLGPLTDKQRNQALATIFGSRAIKGAQDVLIQGTAAWDKNSKAVNRNGAAADVAAAKMKGLHGAAMGLQSQAETLAIDLFEHLGPGLESVVRTISADVVPAATVLVDLFGEVADGIGAVTGFLGDHKEILIVVAGIYVARLAPSIVLATRVMSAFTRLKVVEFFAGVRGGALGAAGGLRTLASAEAAATLGLTLIATELFEGFNQMGTAKHKAEDLAGSFDKAFDPNRSKRWAAQQAKLNDQLADNAKVGERYSGIWGTFAAGLEVVTPLSNRAADAAYATRDLAEEQDNLAHRMTAATQNTRLLGMELPLTRAEIERLATAAGVKLDGNMGKANRRILEYYNANVATTPTAAELAAATETLGDKAATADDKVKALKDQIDALVDTNVSAKDAEIQWQAAIDAVTKSAKENGTTLDDGTAKGRANWSVVLDAIRASEAHRQALIDQGASQHDLNQAWKDEVDQLRHALGAAGYTKGEIDKLTTSLGFTKDAFKQANVKAELLKDGVKKIPKAVNIDVKFNVDYTVVDLLTGKKPPKVLSPKGGLGGLLSPHGVDGRRASGGPVLPGHVYRINESGQEYFRPDAAGQVLNGAQATRAGRGGTAHDEAASAVRQQTAELRLEARATAQLLREIRDGVRDSAGIAEPLGLAGVS